MKRLCLLLLLLCLLLPAGSMAEGVLDLSGQSFESVEAIAQAIDAAEPAASVDLGSMELTWAQRKELMAQYP